MTHEEAADLTVEYGDKLLKLGDGREVCALVCCILAYVSAKTGTVGASQAMAKTMDDTLTKLNALKH